MAVHRTSHLCAGLFSAALAGSAAASFHLMQIEQVIGGVNNNSNVQAIQLRMRSPLQNELQFSRLVVRDAAGANPVTIIDFPNGVPNHGTGVRVLVGSPGFASNTNPPVSPDFTMANLIPVSYLDAGTLTFEDTAGMILWRLSWGGAAYTGPGTGAITNDADGNFNPPFADQLPSTSLSSLRFGGPASAPSTNNAADYALSAPGAVFTNNAGSSGAVFQLPQTGACCMPDATCADGVTPSDCAKFAGTYQGHGTECAKVACSLPCPADIAPEPDGDGVVDVNDLLLVVGNWGATDPNVADINGDLVVDVNDLLAVVGAWGPCP